MNNTDQNRQLVNQFYTAFAEKNAIAMNSCYAENAVFEDPVFRRLNGSEVKAMWEMLVLRGGEALKISYEILEVTQGGASVRWIAVYPFSQTLRMVRNVITAQLIIEEGEIVYHKDHFNLWKWSSMALGLPGMLFGWSKFMQGKIQSKAKKALDNYMEKQQTT